MDESVLWDLSYGMYVVGVKDRGRDTGCVINTAMQITVTPVTIAISMNKDNYTYSVLQREGQFALSILSERAPSNTLAYLGFTSGRDTDKFAEVAHHDFDGAPVVDEGVVGYLKCQVIASQDLGSHVVLFAEVTDTRRGEDRDVMTYQYYHQIKKGRAPKNAPTYQQEKAAHEGPARYVCSVCGYVYEGDIDQEPDDYRCPICKAAKSRFVKQ